MFFFAVYAVGKIDITQIGILRVFALTVIYGLVRGTVFVHLAEYAWSFNQHRARIKSNNDLLTWVVDDQLVIGADTFLRVSRLKRTQERLDRIRAVQRVHNRCMRK